MSETPKQQNLSDTKSLEKPFIVYRGERLLVPESTDCHATIKTEDGQVATFKVRDISAFGIRVYSTNKDFILRINQTIVITLYFFNSAVFESAASVMNESSNDDQISYGLNLTSTYLEVENIRAIISNTGAREHLQVGSSLTPLLNDVKPEFKALVADLNSVFNEIKNRLQQECDRINETALNDQHKGRMRENTLSLAVSLNLQTILEIFNRFQEVVNTFSPDENTLHKKYFRLNFGETIQKTPFLKRAFEKPLGYPGDYGLMVMFYDYQDLGDSIFDKFMHRLSCNQPIAVANQNRVEFLSDLLANYYSRMKTKKIKISSVACGPAHEINLFLKHSTLEKKDQVEVVLVDHESRALDYAIENLKKVGQSKCDFKLTAFKEDAVLGILKGRPFVSQMENSDVIICAGLYDYLSDRVAGKLTEQLMERLKPGGSLLIGNVSTEHPNKFSMEYFMEWNLVLRSPVKLLSLVPERWRNQGGFSANVISESLGINLFLEIRRD